jgi:hypothetical protein
MNFCLFSFIAHFVSAMFLSFVSRSTAGLKMIVLLLLTQRLATGMMHQDAKYQRKIGDDGIHLIWNGEKYSHSYQSEDKILLHHPLEKEAIILEKGWRGIRYKLMYDKSNLHTLENAHDPALESFRSTIQAYNLNDVTAHSMLRAKVPIGDGKGKLEVLKWRPRTPGH